jgi:hypothetical protein
MAGGNYDADGNYLYGNNFYFTTGAGSDTTPPTVTFVSPANNATSVPLNSQIMVKFSTPINENNTNVITVTPQGGSPISGTVSLASDLVTLTFVPSTSLQQGTVFTVAVNGFTDIVGNNGTPFTSTFTTTASSVVLNVSTGINSNGQAILVGDTPDPHWSYVASAIRLTTLRIPICQTARCPPFPPTCRLTSTVSSTLLRQAKPDFMADGLATDRTRPGLTSIRIRQQATPPASITPRLRCPTLLHSQCRQTVTAS